ncbi:MULTISPECIES: type I-E CRISPR-associated protein Cas6/Cse3/CasE [Streptomyces]|uniref:Type I-E CRISPR-associated protein Cas6/Cse3/CasE n=2 Tax=Streptomyces TaxID=1883 RepID=A0A3M8FA66_9ACTN|nr:MULTISPECIES: type I-E CRISPR-associated protein Cas6/Cse3/CasE [Streptomyces]KNE78852.1 CRISPR-associated protein [Streptomyces fradiae]OFA33990.1 type I-E CRISPR-associated protein Cas6/Cse3/CasE [Streptomyces fradiae]PQM23192.1 type I-E CRISPR-associated protein Cas6/Cse3/CasE [Streptomyces xinghaiensis]RKM94752.1 type I-E CRISPR-associated protein Cas6/Cse3/CasE [Streptomyces xinghaiensis]RNC74806.1 type I-E CRISPR-associated protein Cas6/Cse3/CasE [Streptomyces xinghaiensis]
MTAWLTRIIPDQRSADARRDTAGTDGAIRLHRRLMSLFPDDAGPEARRRFGVLFRTEDTPAGLHILLQSTEKPDLTRLPDGYGDVRSRPLDPLLDALRAGLTVRYRCVASAVRKPGATTRAQYNLPAVVPLSGAAADEWWLRQADATGLKPLQLHSQPLDTVHGRRGNSGPAAQQRVRHARTRFDGTAAITDPDQLREKIIEGIGRGKPYGCGLLSIAPARDAA